MKCIASLGLSFFFLSCHNVDNSIQFEALNQSLVSSIVILKNENNRVYEELEKKLNDPQTRMKAEIWEPKAVNVKALSTKLTNYIDTLKRALKADSSAKFVDDLFVDREAAMQLFRKISVCKKELIGTVAPQQFQDNPVLQKALSIFCTTLDAEILPDANQPSTLISTSSIPSTKMLLYFKNQDGLGATVMLNKIQQDVLTAENRLISYFNMMTYSNSNSYYTFSPVVGQNSSYLKKGQVLEIYAGMAVFSNAMHPRITINGVELETSSNAKAAYRTTITDMPGNYQIPVTIDFVAPDGSRKHVSNTVSYAVGK